MTSITLGTLIYSFVIDHLSAQKGTAASHDSELSRHLAPCPDVRRSG